MRTAPARTPHPAPCARHRRVRRDVRVQASGRARRPAPAPGATPGAGWTGRPPSCRSPALRRRLHARQAPGVLPHCPERKGADAIRARRVEVHLLAVTLRLKQVGPRPPGRRRAGRGCVEGERHFVARARHHEAVVRAREQAVDRPRRGIGADHLLPRRDARHVLVVVEHGPCPVARDLAREPTPCERGRQRNQGRDRRRRRHRRARTAPRPTGCTSSSRCAAGGRACRGADRGPRRRSGDGRRARRPLCPTCATCRRSRAPAARAARARARGGSRRRCRTRRRSPSSRSAAGRPRRRPARRARARAARRSRGRVRARSPARASRGGRRAAARRDRGRRWRPRAPACRRPPPASGRTRGRAPRPSTG